MNSSNRRLMVAALVALSIPATAYAQSCWRQALLDLVEPEVVVIEGDADPMQVKELWDALEGQLIGPAELHGPHEIALGQEIFVLEKQP